MKSRITIFQLMLFHLAVRDGDFRLGDQCCEMARHVLDILDAVVDEKDLSAAVEFANDHVANQAVVEMGDESPHHLAIGGRRLDNREVANPEHRHVQRARNRRRRHGQHLDQFAQALDAFLVGDAEAMLLVDNQQAQLGKFDVALQQPMGADDDIDQRLAARPRSPCGSPLAMRKRETISMRTG